MKESEVVLQKLMEKPYNLIVFGGGCLQQGTNQVLTHIDPGATLHNTIPQV